ncbi:hypothetical protein lerEdw1_010765, partial [Lerista edwardsae]
PSGKKFRSKPQLARYLGNTVDLSSFDFRTGKMMPSKLQKNKQRLRNDSLNQNKGKPDLNTTLPIRQTASIFKQPVTKVTNHPSNKVKSDPQRVIEQPRQLFWEKRLQGLSASDVSEQIIKSMELPKGLQGVGPGNSDDTLLSAVASALHTSSAPITGQLSAAVEKNPAVWLNTSQPLCKAFIVTDEDIRTEQKLMYFFGFTTLIHTVLKQGNRKKECSRYARSWRKRLWQTSYPELQTQVTWMRLRWTMEKKHRKQRIRYYKTDLSPKEIPGKWQPSHPLLLPLVFHHKEEKDLTHLYSFLIALKTNAFLGGGGGGLSLFCLMYISYSKKE